MRVHMSDTPSPRPVAGTEAIDAIEHCIGVSRHATKFKNMADEAEAQLAALRARLEEGERWIPVSERLPDNGDHVLITNDDGDVESTAYWDYGDGETEWRDDHGFFSFAVAWRPLPKPYSLPPSGGTE